MTHSTRARTALARLGEEDPALAVLALWCRHRDAEGGVRTHGNTILYGPSFTLLGLPEQVGLVAHHVLHVALQHSDRQAALAERLGARFDKGLFALAADSILNETLQLAGHALRRPAVLLTDLLESIDQPAKSAISALADWDTDRLAMYLHNDPQRSEKARKFGQSRGFRTDLEAGEPDGNADGRSAADWRNQLVRALEAGRKAGTGIGKFGAILADLAPPGIPWEVQLRRILAKALAQEPQVSFRRPAGRWVAMTSDAMARRAPEPVFEPGRSRDAMRPRLVVALDTSSSIDPGTLALFSSEAQGVSRRTGAEVHLLAFDEDVHVARRLDAKGPRLVDLDMRVGGGTDFAPVLAHATGLDPSLLIVLTDLDGPLGAAPAYPVLWAVPGQGSVAPPFGRVLRIGD
ncbi:VWA-like domain-containing protein [Hasllibacter sp. MH4015]|uniref:vWA domain-containing protein n=1 Tax=Hasllibacter sp. MH4015 TaxID=2854029 RepID=UPI001CD446EE